MTKEKEEVKQQNEIDLNTLREKMLKLERTLNDFVYGYENEIKAILCALIAGEHVVLISPPGMAKSYIVYNLAKLVECKFFSYLLTKFTTDVELLGGFNIKKLLTEGKFVRNWSELISSDIVFLDEIFKANSAILNALLSILNERIIHDNYTGEIIQTKIWTVFGASNEVPEEDELKALYDRFAVRIFLFDNNDLNVLANIVDYYWKNFNIKYDKIISIDEIKKLNEIMLSMITYKISNKISFLDIYKQEVLPLIVELRQKGVFISRRTIAQKLPKLLCSYCILYGFTYENVTTGFYELMRFLINREDELKIIDEFVKDLYGELTELIEKLEKAKTAFKNKQLDYAKNLIHEILNFDQSKLANRPFLVQKYKLICREAEHLLQKILKIEKMLSEEE